MNGFDWTKQVHSFDERRHLVIPGNAEETVLFCTKQFIQIGREAIDDRGFFVVALSGGSTPNAIFKKLSETPYRSQLDWTKVLCFWSDERSVPPDHPESNYHMAMQSGLAQLPIPKEQIFRMEAEQDIEKKAKQYEQLFLEKVPSQRFDLMMLGMGEDGHTASLFPFTQGLHTNDQLVIANYVPQKQTWRMSVTYNCIQASRHIFIYVIGKNKAETIVKVLTGLYEPDQFPIQRVGTVAHKALWILDQEASCQLTKLFEQQ